MLQLAQQKNNCRWDFYPEPELSILLVRSLLTSALTTKMVIIYLQLNLGEIKAEMYYCKLQIY